MEERTRQLYKLGQAAIAANHAQAKQSTVQFAALHGLTEHTIRKLKAFARSYSLQELDEFCKLRRPDGLPLNWGYLPALLTLPCQTEKQKQQRAHLQATAAKNGWTAPELYAEIKRRYPSRPKKKQKPNVLVQQSLSQLEQLDAYLTDPPRDKLPDEVAAQLPKLKTLLNRVRGHLRDR